MNIYDSDQIQRILKTHGYDATPFLETADLIIMNTCSIREKAEQKVFSFLGRLTALKRKKLDMILGVGGCVAQQEGKNILDRMPHLDFVFGTRAINRLPDIIGRVTKKRDRIVDIDMTAEPEAGRAITKGDNLGATARFVTIMRGCDNYCAYCVVPYVRGRETSRRLERVLEEIRVLVDSGVREVTLLGQNVNSYGKKEGLCSFPQLLSHVNDIQGLERIRFTTSHPKDFSEDLIDAFRDLDKLCNHIHLPVQSGSNRILNRMNRKYCWEDYLEKLEKLRKVCPEIAITTDIIVGFPGETRQDFNETLELIKSVKYDSLFAFKYSDRAYAPASAFLDKVSEAEKKERLAQVLGLQKTYTIQQNQALVNTVQAVLVDGYSKKHHKMDGVQWSGRTTTNKIVNFVDDDGIEIDKKNRVGDLVPIRIERALSHSLWGRPVEPKQRAHAP